MQRRQPVSVAAEAVPLALGACPVCGAEALEEILPPFSAPLYCNVLRPDRDAAIGAARGLLALAACGACGHVCNTAFDPAALDYTPDYENSLHHSAHFSAYAGELAARLVARYDLHGKLVVDVGCGLGDFLALICRLGGNRGLGYDRSCPPRPPASAAGADVTLVPEFFSHRLDLPPIDFLICRQVLEHIADPVDFLEEIRRSPAVTADTRLFFEVPNAAHSFEGEGIWDLIYEHCSYFGSDSLSTLFRRCGFEVTATYGLFSGQYLGIEARPAPAGVLPALSPGKAAGAEPFATRFAAMRGAWQQAVAGWAAAGERVVIWGAGSKGVSFLDAQQPCPIAYAVDLNPRKVGRFLPGSGAEVVSPEFLTTYRPDRVILMNGVYRDEVAARLAELGLSPVLVTA